MPGQPGDVYKRQEFMGAGEEHLRGIDTLFQKVVGFGNLAVCPVQLTGNGFQGGLEGSDPVSYTHLALSAPRHIPGPAYLASGP